MINEKAPLTAPLSAAAARQLRAARSVRTSARTRGRRFAPLRPSLLSFNLFLLLLLSLSSLLLLLSYIFFSLLLFFLNFSPPRSAQSAWGGGLHFNPPHLRPKTAFLGITPHRGTGAGGIFLLFTGIWAGGLGGSMRGRDALRAQPPLTPTTPPPRDGDGDGGGCGAVRRPPAPHPGDLSHQSPLVPSKVHWGSGRWGGEGGAEGRGRRSRALPLPLLSPSLLPSLAAPSSLCCILHELSRSLAF